MANFTFNNMNNFDDMDCIIVGPVKYPVPTEIVEYEPVDGRKGKLTRKTGTYNDSAVQLKLQVNYINGYDEEYKEKIQAITEWLTEFNDNRLVFDDNTEKCYRVKEVNIGEFEDYKKFYSRFTVDFICEPFMSYYNEALKEIKNGQVIYNRGSVESEPVIELELPATTQNIQITINDKTFQLKNVKDKAIIQTEIFNCMNDTGNIRTIGEFPILQKGKNVITWSGTVNKFRMLTNFKFRG